MTLIRNLVLVLFSGLLCSSYSNAQALDPTQIYTTPNITDNSAWIGGVYQQNLTCWAWGDPGYCGPQPIVRPGGNINFSYGSSYLYQQHSVSTIFPNAAGLQVNGYNFSFTAKNGNGWDDGRVDSLTALVRFWDTTGSRGTSNLLYGASYDLNYKFNWTNFNFSETFTSPLPTSSIGAVQYGFIGKDNNYWAGPYGPEVYNVNFNLKYSVDPCASNPLYSPTCSGYLEALSKLVPTQTIEVVQALPPPPPPIELAPPPPLQQSAQQAPPPRELGPQPIQQGTLSTSGPSPVQTAQQQEKQSSGTPNLSLALSLIAKNQEKEKAIEQQTVQMAVSEAQSTVSRVEREAVQTATAMSVVSVDTANSTNSSSQQGTTTNSSRLNTGLQLQQQSQGGTGLQANLNSMFKQTSIIQQIQGQIQLPQNNYQVFDSATKSQQPQLLASVAVEQVQSVQYTPSFNNQKSLESEPVQNTASLITDRSNPLRDIIESAPVSIGEFIEQHRDSSKRVQQVNDLAVGVDLAMLAQVPQGYTSYTGLVLKDATFYEPREVYRGQRTIDNIRALRGLGSDRKHQDLVNSQYK